VEVRSDWEVKEEMDFPQLMKMRYLEVSEPQDIECCGALEYYDKAFDRITTRSEKPLRSIKRIFHTVTTTDDPVIRKLAKTQGNVFATDAILATLMSCTRSVYSWDIVVQRVGSKLFFDKRDNSDFDLLTVSETANEPPQDEGNSFNSPRNLAMEATYINHNFSQQCLRMGKERYNFPNPNPFVEDDMDKNEVASVAYRYRRWKLGDDIDLIVRCEHDGVMTGANGEVSFINIKTLNEWDSRVRHPWSPCPWFLWAMLSLASLALQWCRLASEVGLSARGCHCHRAEEQQLQVGPMDVLRFAGRIGVSQAWLRVPVPRERLLAPRHPGHPAVQAQ